MGCAKDAWIYRVTKQEKLATTAGNGENMKIAWSLLSQAQCKYTTVLCLIACIYVFSRD